jgi:Uma2 family endonuclease
VSSTFLTPVEDYLSRTEKPWCEYRDGVLLAKSMPTRLHGLVQYTLVFLLRRLGLDAVPEVTLRLSPTRFLIPDVIAAKSIADPYPVQPVDLCCEILSPEDRLGATLAKCEEYHAWGVSYCWVIDPVKRTAWEYHAGSEPHRIESTLHAGQTAIEPAELFAAA